MLWAGTPNIQPTKMTSTNKAATKGKRTPARPHRRLDLETIDSRITKLQKRLDHAKTQIADAERHVDGYVKEKHYRDEEMLDKEEVGSVEGVEKAEKAERLKRLKRLKRLQRLKRLSLLLQQMLPPTPSCDI